jgi:iron uptake system EfeUOB component EfeO/EfeM
LAREPVWVNVILAHYTLNSFGDYDKMEDADQREIIHIVRSLGPTK